jgi:hypothetical protein
MSLASAHQREQMLFHETQPVMESAFASTIGHSREHEFYTNFSF